MLTTVDSHDRESVVTVRAERLLAATEAWQHCGVSGRPVLTSAVSLFGVRAGVAYCLDHHEVSRRDALGLGAITDRCVLDGLIGLPVGIPVSVAALPERHGRLFRRVPAGLIEFDGDQVVRVRCHRCQLASLLCLRPTGVLVWFGPAGTLRFVPVQCCCLKCRRIRRT